MSELTDIAGKIDRAAQILSGPARAASRDCTWLQRHPDLHAEIISLQDELRQSAASLNGTSDLGLHFMEAQSVGNRLCELFQAEELDERLEPQNPAAFDSLSTG